MWALLMLVLQDHHLLGVITLGFVVYYGSTFVLCLSWVPELVEQGKNYCREAMQAEAEQLHELGVGGRSELARYRWYHRAMPSSVAHRHAILHASKVSKPTAACSGLPGSFTRILDAQY